MNKLHRSTPKALAIAVMLAFAPATFALPTGGAVSAGGATISTSGNTTTIGQTTQSAAINWQAFSIGAGEAVRFVQPSSSSVALNRVLGPDPSSILGSLSANGKVFLVNPNGILFGPGAQVNVGGLVASTRSITDADFMAGTYKFSGNSGASVVNRGSINADGGYVALMGANVSNEGVISARLGTVVLASGNAMTLDLAGDGLLSVAVSEGTANALVQNSGTIRADGGQVLLTTQAAGTLLQGVVNNTGVIQAQTIDTRDGMIRLMGDMQNGTVNAGGTLDASAPNGGNGGFIETSAAHVKISNDVRVNAAAPAGTTGTWLIDPVDFVVGSAPGNNITGAALSAAVTNASVTINTAGPGAGNGDITINEAITWNGLIGLSAAPTTLTLNAVRNTNINAAITATSGNLVVCCGGDVNVNAAITTTNGSVLLSGRDVNVVRSILNPLTAITATDGNIELCAVRDINLSNTLNPGLAPLMTQTRSSAIPAESLIALGVPVGMTLIAGSGSTAPGAANGSVNFTNGGLAGTFITLTGPAAPATIIYNPTSYATPTNYAPNFTGTGGPVTALMLVHPVAADKQFDGTNTAVLTGLQGVPAGVSLVAGPGSTATFDTTTVGNNKPITYSGFTLAGAGAAAFSLPVACCGAPATRTVGNILPVPIPPVVVPPVVIVPVEGDLVPVVQNPANPVHQYQRDAQIPLGFAGLGLAVLWPGVGMPPVQLAVAPPPPPPAPVVVVPQAPPVVVPPPVPPQIYVPPVRERKPDRN